MPYFLRNAIKPGMSFSAVSNSFLPQSLRLISATLYAIFWSVIFYAYILYIVYVFVLIFLLLLLQKPQTMDEDSLPYSCIRGGIVHLQRTDV